MRKAGILPGLARGCFWPMGISRLIFGKNTGLLSRTVAALPLALDRRVTLEWVGSID
jgi:hypothetical protein